MIYELTSINYVNSGKCQNFLHVLIYFIVCDFQDRLAQISFKAGLNGGLYKLEQGQTTIP